MNKTLIKHIVGIPILIFIVFISDYVCPIHTFSGIRCIGCGITSAYLSAFNLDFVSAFNHHPLYLIIPFYVLWLIHLHTPLFDRIPQKVKYAISIGVGSIVLIQYILSFYN